MGEPIDAMGNLEGTAQGVALSLVHKAFPKVLKPSPAEQAELYREAEQAYLTSPESGLSFVQWVLKLVADEAPDRKRTGHSRSQIFTVRKWARDISPAVLSAIKGTTHDTTTKLGALMRLGVEAQVAKVEEWRTGKAAPALTADAADRGEWWTAVPGFIETRHRFVVPGEVEVYHADSKLKLAELLAAGRRFDVCTCDPPYGIGLDRNGRKVAGDESAEAAAEWFTSMVYPLMNRDTHVLACTRRDVSHIWRRWLAGDPARRIDDVTWDKCRGNFLGDPSATFNSQSEDILVAHHGKPKLREWTNEVFRDLDPGQRVRRDTNLWSIPPDHDALAMATKHPTLKPVDLGTRMLLNCSDVGDWALDPCCGTGPFIVAAVKSGRRAVGVELRAMYFKAAVARVKQALRKRGPRVQGACNDDEQSMQAA